MDRREFYVPIVYLGKTLHILVHSYENDKEIALGVGLSFCRNLVRFQMGTIIFRTGRTL